MTSVGRANRWLQSRGACLAAVFCVSSFISAVDAHASTAASSGVTVVASSVKPVFLDGEPIAITVDIKNNRHQQVWVPISYPWIQGIKFGDARVTLGQSERNMKYGTAGESSSNEFEIPLVPIQAGKHWSIVIYLQRFVPQPPPGIYKLPYFYDLNFYSDDDLPLARDHDVHARGKVEFRIVPRNSEHLEKIVNQYSDSVDPTEFWKSRAAIEALSLVRDPVVIPYFVRQLELGCSKYALNRLAQFPDNKEAVRAIAECRDKGVTPTP